MPPMHLTSVDLPAPLSPTRAVTSPARAVKSTLRRTCTGPKLLSSPRSSSRGVALTSWCSCRTGVAGRPVGLPAPVPAPRVDATPGRALVPVSMDVLADSGGGALGGVVAGAQVGLGDVPVSHDVLDVVLVDRDRVGEHGRDVLVQRGVLDGLLRGRLLA